MHQKMVLLFSITLISLNPFPIQVFLGLPTVLFVSVYLFHQASLAFRCSVESFFYGLQSFSIARIQHCWQLSLRRFL